MFEIYVENDLPYMRSPYETTPEQFQNLFERALKTGCLLRFTLECLSPAKNHDSVEIEPNFDVKFGAIFCFTEARVPHCKERKNI